MEIIKETLINFTAKDTMGIILSFAFDKCHICREYKQDRDLMKMYNTTHICHKCVVANEMRLVLCMECEKHYHLSRGVFCACCSAICKVFCPICLPLSCRVLYPFLLDI
jgi:hypothetical protein